MPQPTKFKIESIEFCFIPFYIIFFHNTEHAKTKPWTRNLHFCSKFLNIVHCCYESHYTLWEQKNKMFTGLQKVMVKDFSWNIIAWNASLFEKTLKPLSILDIENYGFIVNTCPETAKRAETRVGFPVIFSRLGWPIEPKFSQVCNLYISCDTRRVGVWTILFTESVQWL